MTYILLAPLSAWEKVVVYTQQNIRPYITFDCIKVILKLNETNAERVEP